MLACCERPAAITAQHEFGLWSPLGPDCMVDGVLVRRDDSVANFGARLAGTRLEADPTVLACDLRIGRSLLERRLRAAASLLAQVPELRVIARTSSFSFKGKHGTSPRSPARSM